MSASLRAPAIGTSIPEGYHLRDYRESDHDVLMDIQLRNFRRWHPERENFEFFDPGDPTCAGVLVWADEHDVPVAALGARVVVEVGTVIDDERVGVHFLRDAMMSAWARFAVRLFRQGHKLAFCRVSSPTPGWVNMLVRRLRWQPNRYPHLYFDLEKNLSKLKIPGSGRVQ